MNPFSKPIASCLFGLFGVFATNIVEAADIAAGEAVYNSNACSGCHGVAGKSQIDIYPALSGRSAGFIAGELTKFRSKARLNATMNAMASRLSDADIENIAEYLSSR